MGVSAALTLALVAVMFALGGVLEFLDRRAGGLPVLQAGAITVANSSKTAGSLLLNGIKVVQEPVVHLAGEPN